MRLGYVLPLTLFALTACQTEIYPEAPTVPPRTTTSTPTPSQDQTTAPKPGFTDGQVVASGQGWLEFAPLESPNNNGRIFFAFFPYDSKAQMPSSSAHITGSATMTDTTAGTTPETKALQVYAADSSSEPVIYCWPTLVSKHSYKIHATLQVDATAYTGDFTYQAK